MKIKSFVYQVNRMQKRISGVVKVEENGWVSAVRFKLKGNTFELIGDDKGKKFVKEDVSRLQVFLFGGRL